jgi:hypothetical protein
MLVNKRNINLAHKPSALIGLALSLLWPSLALAEKGWVDPGAAQSTPAAPAPTPPSNNSLTTPKTNTAPAQSDAAKTTAQSEQHVRHMKPRHKGARTFSNAESEGKKISQEASKATIETPVKPKKKVVKIKPKSTSADTGAPSAERSNDYFPNLFNDD